MVVGKEGDTAVKKSSRADRGANASGLKSSPCDALAAFLPTLYLAMVAGSAVADVRLAVAAIPHAGESPAAARDRVVALVELLQGDVLFDSPRGLSFAVFALEESSLALYEQVAAQVPGGLAHTLQLVVCNTGTCATVPVPALVFIDPGDRNTVVAQVLAAGGAIEQEVIVGAPGSAMALVVSVPVGFLPTLESIPGNMGFELVAEPEGLPSAGSLLLGRNNPFRVVARWSSNGTTGNGLARRLSASAGSFSFFRPSNLELHLKILDGCGVNGHYWLFATGMTDRGVVLEIFDNRSPSDVPLFVHENPEGRVFRSMVELDALPCA